MQPAPSRIELPRFPGGKRIAVTTSWDDGVVEDRRVVAAFNEWGLKSEGVFFIWRHAYEFNRPGHDWSDLERVYRPLSGKDDVWYCTNIELFDYESARRRLVLAANRRSAFNPSGIPVTINVDGEVVDVAPGKTISLGVNL